VLVPGLEMKAVGEVMAISASGIKFSGEAGGAQEMAGHFFCRPKTCFTRFSILQKRASKAIQLSIAAIQSVRPL
jgi:hypothetical protein